VSHVLLDAEVGDGDVEVQRGGEADGREIVGTVGAAADVVEIGELEDAPEVGDPTGVDDVGADEVDELLGDELLAVPDGVEDLPTASGVVVCCRMIRKPSWSSAGTRSSSQNSWYSSTRRPSRAASIGVSRWWASWRSAKSKPKRSRTASKSAGIWCR